MLPALPILSDANRQSEASWHAYVTRVYGTPLARGHTFDLNQLTWFYTHLQSETDETPAGLLLRSPCVEVCPVHLGTQIYDGTAWIGHSYPGVLVASNVFGSIGFFVHRPAPPPSQLENCSHLEVGHVRTDFKGGERGLSWFFHTKGSGVFLDCQNLPTRGRIAVYKNRIEFGQKEHSRWANDEGHPRWWMRQNGVAMIIFTEADFGIYGFSRPDSRSPRTEVIVLHRDNAGASELDHGDRGVCLDSPSIGVRTRAGWDGERPCVCSPLRIRNDVFLHCDHQSQPHHW